MLSLPVGMHAQQDTAYFVKHLPFPAMKPWSKSIHGRPPGSHTSTAGLATNGADGLPALRYQHVYRPRMGRRFGRSGIVQPHRPGCRTMGKDPERSRLQDGTAHRQASRRVLSVAYPNHHSLRRVFSLENGKGDVVKELRDACTKYDMKFGVYLSPWDRNASCYGDSPAYNKFFIEQLTELLTNYGEVHEVWFDGANGEGPNGKNRPTTGMPSTRPSSACNPKPSWPSWATTYAG